MECNAALETFSAWLNGEHDLPMDLVDAHFSSCEACNLKAMTLAKSDRLLHELAAVDSAPQFQKRLRERMRRNTPQPLKRASSKRITTHNLARRSAQNRRNRLGSRAGAVTWIALSAAALILIAFILPPLLRKDASATALATLEFAGSGAKVLRGNETVTVTNGMPVFASDILQTSGQPARIIYADQTNVACASNTRVRLFEEGNAKRLDVQSGRVSCDVSRQPPGVEMALLTAWANVTVRGTRFVLTVESTSTELDVEEGLVRIADIASGKSEDVGAGQLAKVGRNFPLTVNAKAKPLLENEIVLYPDQGRIVGADWLLIRDSQANAGTALEAKSTKNIINRRGTYHVPSYVEFSFNAKAGVEYNVWLCGRAEPGIEDAIYHDSAILNFPNAIVTENAASLTVGHAGKGEWALFTGFSFRPGYWWVGGNADPDPNRKLPFQDEPPVKVVFARDGLQTLKLCAEQTPMRIGAIRLSPTQRTRPEGK